MRFWLGVRALYGGKRNHRNAGGRQSLKTPGDHFERRRGQTRRKVTSTPVARIKHTSTHRFARQSSASVFQIGQYASKGGYRRGTSRRILSKLTPEDNRNLQCRWRLSALVPSSRRLAPNYALSSRFHSLLETFKLSLMVVVATHLWYFYKNCFK